MRSAVVFPQPDGPTSTMNSPSSISRFRELTAVVPSGYVFVTPSNVTPAMPSLPSLRPGFLPDSGCYWTESPRVGVVASGAWTPSSGP